MWRVQLYVSSYGSESSLENRRSRLIQSLMLAHEELVDEIIVADLNQEMIRAKNSMLGIEENDSVLAMDRQELANRLGLVKSGQSLDPSGVDLPQAFLMFTKGERVLERSFIGHYETIQYLEDCGILAKVLKGELCAHFRPYQGHIFFSWCRSLEHLESRVEICSTCHL